MPAPQWDDEYYIECCQHWESVFKALMPRNAHLEELEAFEEMLKAFVDERI